jgi:hypothetical protein
MIKIDIEGGCSLLHPEYLVKIVPMRALAIPAGSESFFKRADVKLFSGAGCVIGKRKYRGFRRLWI